MPTIIETLQIIVTAPVLLDLLLCHSRAWLPREESRSLPTSSSGIRPRAPDTRAGMTEKFDRTDVRVTILCRTQLDPSPAQLRERASGAAVACFCNGRDARVRVQPTRRAVCPLDSLNAPLLIGLARGCGLPHPQAGRGRRAIYAVNRTSGEGNVTSRNLLQFITT